MASIHATAPAINRPAVFTPKLEQAESRISLSVPYKNKSCLLGIYNNTRRILEKKRLPRVVKSIDGHPHNLEGLRTQSHLLPSCLCQRHHRAGSVPRPSSGASLPHSCDKGSSDSEGQAGTAEPLDFTLPRDEVQRSPFYSPRAQRPRPWKCWFHFLQLLAHLILRRCYGRSQQCQDAK